MNSHRRCAAAAVMLCAAAGAARGAGFTLLAIADMHEVRASHTATSLVDGDVLIVGGFTDDEARPAGAELFDNRRERFLPLAPPRTARHSHTATLLADGRVLIAGGQGPGNSYLASAELYDPASRTFRATGNLTMARANHVSVRLDDGRVLLIGGTGTGWSFLAGAEIYDPATGVFAATGNMAEPREGHAAALLGTGGVLVMGGHHGRGAATVILRTAEIYDIASGRFRPAGAMAMRRHKHEAVALPDGRILVLGGADERDNRGVYDSVEAFDPAAGAFRACDPMRTGRYKHRGTAFLLGDGRLLLAGGSPRAEIYDPSGAPGALVEVAPRMAGQFCAAAALPGDRYLVTGGYGEGRGPRAQAWIIAPAEVATPTRNR